MKGATENVNRSAVVSFGIQANFDHTIGDDEYQRSTRVVNVPDWKKVLHFHVLGADDKEVDAKVTEKRQ